MTFALNYFGSKVLGGAAKGPRAVRDPLGEAEVCDFEVTFAVEKQVFRLQIPVHDGQWVQVVEGGDDLDRVKQRRRRVEPAGTENGGSASFAPQNVRVPMWHVVSVTRFGKILMVYLFLANCWVYFGKFVT